MLVLREVTERPEAVEAGTVHLVGTDRVRIVGWTRQLLDDAGEYDKMARAVNPYGEWTDYWGISAKSSSCV